MTSYLLGIDIGTTATKGILCDPEGILSPRRRCPVTLHSPQPGWAEEDRRSGGPISAGSSGNVWTGQASPPRPWLASASVGWWPTVVLVDEAGRVLRPSIQQSDARSYEEIQAFKARVDEEYLLRQTGSSVTQQSIGPQTPLAPTP